jgi:hypothetical protein
MTNTLIPIPDYVTTAKSVTAIAGVAADMLASAEASGMPMPRHLSMSPVGQEISMGFRGIPEAFGALAQWAEQFSSAVTAAPHTSSDGEKAVHAEVRFAFEGVSVKAYAFITAGEPSTG